MPTALPQQLPLAMNPSRLLDRLWRAQHGLERTLRCIRRHVAFYVRQFRPAPAPPIPATYEHDLLAWGQHFLPHHFQSPPSAMHREVAALLDEASRERQRPEEPALKLNLLAPRGSAKSTLVTLSYVLREALTGRQPYIWIVSDTKHQAMSHLDNLYAELQDNPELLKSHCRARGWIKTGNRLALSDVLIEAFGTGQRLRGQRFRQHRPTLVVCDDLQNDGHMQSATQRDRSRSWFHGMLLKAGTKRTKIINLGTALHREVIALELHTTPGWTSRRYQAIQQWPTNMHLWAEWEELYRGQNAVAVEAQRGRESASENAQQDGLSLADADSRPHSRGPDIRVPSDITSAADRQPASLGETRLHVSPSPRLPFSPSSSQQSARNFYSEHRHEMEAGSALLWPEEEDLYTLMCMRAESGPAAFEREKQCVPMNPEECEWPEAYFGDDIWFSHWPQDLRLKTIALDPSKGTDAKHGDYSAFVMLGIANDGTLYVEANLARRPTPQIVTDGVELIKQFQPQAFGIETNQFQALLGADFEAELKKQRLFGTLPFTINNHLAKPVRIRRLGPLLANRNLKFKSNSPGTTMLVEQLRELPLAKHDDGPDALEMALQLAETIAKPTPSDGLGNRLI